MNNSENTKSPSSHESSHHHHHHHHNHRHHHPSFSRHSSSTVHSHKKQHSTNKQRSLVAFFLLLLSIIIEFFPYGLITRFITGRPISAMGFDQIFTYFATSGYGHTNWGTILLTAASLVLFALSIVRITHSSNIIKRIFPILTTISLVIAILPLFFGANNLSPANICIAVIFALVLWLTTKNPFDKR